MISACARNCAKRANAAARKSLGKRGVAKVDQHRYDPRLRQQFVQHFEPLRTDLGIEIGHPRHVAAGPVEARDQSGLHRIDGNPEDDRNRRRRRLGSQGRGRTAGRDDHVHMTLD